MSPDYTQEIAANLERAKASTGLFELRAIGGLWRNTARPSNRGRAGHRSGGRIPPGNQGTDRQKLILACGLDCCCLPKPEQTYLPQVR